MVCLSRSYLFKFLTAVFHKFYLVHFWILYPKWSIAVIEKQFVLVPYYSLALKTRSGVFVEHCFLFKANQLLLNIASWNGSQNSTDRQQKLSLGPLTYLGSLLCNMLHWKGNKLQVDTHVWWPWGAIVKFKNKN